MRSVETVTSIGRRLRYAQIGGGRDSFIGAIHRRAAGAGRVRGADRRRAVEHRRQGARLGSGPATAARALLRELTGAGRGRARLAGGGADRLRVDRHAQPRALRAGPGLCRGGLPCRHRQADGARQRAGRAAGPRGGRARHRVRRDLQLHRLPDDQGIKEARHQVAQGRIGTIRRVVVEYAQGWLSHPIDAEGHKQAAWRTDPARAGIAGALGDIGTHCENLVSYVTGLEVQGAERRSGHLRAGAPAGRRRQRATAPPAGSCGTRKTRTACCSWPPAATPPSPAPATPDGAPAGFLGAFGDVKAARPAARDMPFREPCDA